MILLLVAVALAADPPERPPAPAPTPDLDPLDDEVTPAEELAEDEPSNSGLTPLERELLKGHRREGRAIVAAINAGNASQVAALGEVKTAVYSLKAQVKKSEGGGNIGKIAVWFNENPTAKFALVGFVVLTLNRMGEYVSLRLAGATPSPAQIASAAEAPQPAPVTVITSSTSSAPAEANPAAGADHDGDALLVAPADRR